MKKTFFIEISGNNTIKINAEIFPDESKIQSELQKLFEVDNDLILIIDISNAESAFRTIGKFIHGSSRVGIPVKNIRYKTKEGNILDNEELTIYGNEEEAKRSKGF